MLGSLLCGVLMVACSSSETGKQASELDEYRASAPVAAATPSAGLVEGGEAAEGTIEIPTLEAHGLTPLEERVAAYIDAHTAEAESLLESLVAINSGTGNHRGVREVGKILAPRLEALGFETRWIDQSEVERAGHLFAELPGSRGKRVLLIGHLDTVFERDSPFQEFERLDGGRARGPGVADMKGGDVVIVLALEALHAAGALADRRVVVAFTGDEEDTGKPLDISRRDLIAAARESDVALGFEGGLGAPNTITVARRGFTGWTLDVRARRGHSSVVFSEKLGAGAAYEIARILQGFYQELRGEPYLTFNVGVLLAGTDVRFAPDESRGDAFGKTNVVPQVATASGDLRALTIEQRDAAKDRMRAIVARNLPGTSATIEFVDSYPPMAPTEGNRSLAAELDRVGRDLGMERASIVPPSKRGAADISFVAPYCDALSGLGTVGSGAHSTDEVVNLASLPQVSKRAAILIHRLTRDP